LDGDGQHDPNLIFKLVEPLHNGSVDVVIGSRYLTEGGYRARGIRAIGIRVFALVVRVITGQHFTDTTSGFIATNWDASNFLANNLPSDYPEIEGLVLLCRTGFRVIEVPVKMRPRNSGKSSISHLSSAYYVAKVLLAVFIEILRKPLPKGGSN